MAITSALGTYNGDSSAANTPSRTGSYLEAYVAPVTNKELYTADEGSYWTFITPTSGTGIIGHAAPTTFDETKPYLLIYNGTAKRLYPQFIDFNETVAGVGGTGVTFVPCVDTGNRYSSAGTALTIQNSNLSSSQSSSGLVAYCGAVVATAATSARLQYGDVVFRGTTIDIIGDHYSLIFGAPSSNGGASSKVATLIDSSRIVQPVVVNPGQSFLLHQWRASQSTGPTFQVRMGALLR